MGLISGFIRGLIRGVIRRLRPYIYIYRYIYIYILYTYYIYIYILYYIHIYIYILYIYILYIYIYLEKRDHWMLWNSYGFWAAKSWPFMADGEKGTVFFPENQSDERTPAFRSWGLKLLILYIYYIYISLEFSKYDSDYH